MKLAAGAELLLAVVLGCLLLIYVIFGFYCAYRENAITSMYVEFDVYNKKRAYMFGNMIGAAIWLFVLFVGSLMFDRWDITALALVSGIVCTLIALWLYRAAKRKCPDGPLKGKLAINMYISGLGVVVKKVFSFLGIVGKALEPRRAVDEHGRNILIFFTGDVYDEYGNYLGKTSGSNEYIRKKG